MEIQEKEDEKYIQTNKINTIFDCQPGEKNQINIKHMQYVKF